MEQKKFEIFTLVKTDKKEVKIICGNNLMCNKAFKDYKEAKEYIKAKPYEIIVNLIHLVLTYEKEQEMQLSQKVANEAETNK